MAESWVQAKSMLTKVSANNAVPCGIVLFVKLLLDECSYVFLHVVLLQGLQRVITSHQLVDLDVGPGRCPSNVSVLDYDIRSSKVLHRNASWSELGSASLQKAIPVLHSQWRPAAYPRTCQHS